MDSVNHPIARGRVGELVWQGRFTLSLWASIDWQAYLWWTPSVWAWLIFFFLICILLNFSSATLMSLGKTTRHWLIVDRLMIGQLVTKLSMSPLASVIFTCLLLYKINQPTTAYFCIVQYKLHVKYVELSQAMGSAQEKQLLNPTSRLCGPVGREHYCFIDPSEIPHSYILLHWTEVNICSVACPPVQ